MAGGLVDGLALRDELEQLAGMPQDGRRALLVGPARRPVKNLPADAGGFMDARELGVERVAVGVREIVADRAQEPGGAKACF